MIVSAQPNCICDSSHGGARKAQKQDVKEPAASKLKNWNLIVVGATAAVCMDRLA